MDLDEVVRRRRMTRRFDPSPVEEHLLARVLGVLGHLPSAGFAQGVDALVLTTSSARDRFWSAATEASWRSGGRGAAGILAAPVVVVPVGDPAAYVARYGAPDKARSGLSNEPAEKWPVPYWLVDASFAVLALLLAAEAEGLGALFFRLHRPEDEVLAALGVPPGRTCVGALALGRRAADDRPSGSPGRRRRRPVAEIVHRETW